VSPGEPNAAVLPEKPREQLDGLLASLGRETHPKRRLRQRMKQRQLIERS
jgi:hypothetical protein